MKTSIRARLTGTLILGTGVLMLTGISALYVLVERAFLAQFDQSLLTKTRLLTLFPEVDHDGINLEFTEHSLPEFERPEMGEYYQLWLRDGTVLSKSSSLGGTDLQPQYGAVEKPIFQNIRLPNGHPDAPSGSDFCRLLKTMTPQLSHPAKHHLPWGSWLPATGLRSIAFLRRCVFQVWRQADSC